MRRHFVNRPKTPQLSMTSMIDVIFLLLIFFVCTANFRQLEEQLPMTLDGVGTLTSILDQKPEERDFDVATIRLVHLPEIHWQIEGRTCHSLDELDSVLRQLAAIKHDLPIIIDPEKLVPYQNLIETYDLCRQIGLNRISLAASKNSVAN